MMKLGLFLSVKFFIRNGVQTLHKCLVWVPVKSMMVLAFIAPVVVLAKSLPDPSEPKVTSPVIQIAHHGTGLTVSNPTAIPMSDLVVLEGSSDLMTWIETARFQGDFHHRLGLPETGSALFYRLQTLPMSPAFTWKNQVHFPDDPFRNEAIEEGNSPARWIKFIILKKERPEVIFQDSSRFVFHYDFAKAYLEDFKNMTAEEFNQVTLIPGPQQEAVVGALLLPPESPYLGQHPPAEVGIQFAGSAPFDIEDVIQWFKQVESAVYADEPVRAYYMPAFEQTEEAVNQSDYLADHGIELSHGSRWASGDLAYSTGWAFGRLVFLKTQEIEPAYSLGQLTAQDILITDGVPAELPPLAGIISLTPSTPNSHVAILARSYGIPFVHLIAEVDRDYVLSLQGKEVFYSANHVYGQSDVEIFPVDSDSLEDEARDLLVLAQLPPTLNYAPKASPQRWSAPVAELHPDDIWFFGGKAANFGVLPRSIPDHSPTEAIAFSFDLWDAFMAQESFPGFTLGDLIASRLEPFMSTHPPIQGTKAALDDVREMIKDASFPEALSGVVFEALSGFDADTKIRFRSSTNLEDSSTFTGAGLYDSYSGCLMDDLDADESGPSHCDPTKGKERGVLRAIKKVFASFYNDNAFLERRRRGVVEEEAGMALLVHYSFPDELEWANGVATVSLYASDNTGSLEGDLVTQKGATSVSNPEPGSVPEVVKTRQYSSNSTFLTLESPSSLLPLGENVMLWETDYRQLTTLIKSAGLAYLAEFSGKNNAVLDLEYKKVAPGHLVIKQIREIPAVDPVGFDDHILLDKDVVWTVYQGEHGDLFAMHRLKSTWTFQMANGLLSELKNQPDLYKNTTWTWNPLGEPETVDTPLKALPNHNFTVGETERRDTWTGLLDGETLRWNLQTRFLDYLFKPGVPVVTEEQFEIEWQVDYEKPRPTWNFDGIGTTRQDKVKLVPVQAVDSSSLRQTREFELGNGIAVQTTFYWPSPPSGPSAGYTAPLIAWVETRIQGLTTQEIVLTGPYSQTYLPGHHNFWETYLFEPSREQGLDPSILEELRQANIQALMVEWDWQEAKLSILDRDGKLTNARKP